MRRLLRILWISAAYGAVGLTLLVLVGIAISSTQRATVPKVNVSYVKVEDIAKQANELRRAAGLPEHNIEEIVARSKEQPKTKSETAKNDWMPSGSIGVMGQMGIACRSKTVFDELSDIAVSGDEEAFERARLGLVLAGQCEWIDSGTVLYITDISMFSGMYQVRPKGRADKFWTLQKWVRSS